MRRAKKAGASATGPYTNPFQRILGATGSNSLVFAVRGPAPPPLDATDATLSELILTVAADDTEIAPSPAFSSATTSYSVTHPRTVEPGDVYLTVRLANPQAAVEILGAAHLVDPPPPGEDRAPVVVERVSLGDGRWRFALTADDEGGVTRYDVVVRSQDRNHVQRYRVRFVVRGFAPTLVSAVLAPRGASPTADTVYLRYRVMLNDVVLNNVALRPDGPDPGNPLAPPASAFSVAVDGSPVTVTSAQINGNTVALRLAEAFGHRVRRVTVSYAPPSVNPVQTTRGGLARALTDHPLEIRIPPSGLGTGGADGRQLLHAVMTVGYHTDDDRVGYGTLVGGEPYGSLSRGSFLFNGDDHAVQRMYLSDAGHLVLRLSGSLTQAAAAKLDLYVGGTKFRFADADNFAAGANQRIWLNAGLTWPIGDTVPVLIVDANKPPVFTERGGGTERYLYENPPTPFGRFGAVHRMVPVAATDPDGDALRYALEGRDAHLFTIDEAVGWIMTRADTIYDHETEERTCHYNRNPEFRPCYAMRVRVTDSYGASATKGLSILLDNNVDRVVQNFRVVAPAGTDHELRVSWNPVSPDERPESYEVEWYTADEGESWRWYRKSIEGDRSGTGLRSLEADTRYRVRMRPIYPRSENHRLAYWSRTVVKGTGAAGGPVVRSAAVAANGRAVELLFDEALDTGRLPAGDEVFTVTVDGTEVAVASAIEATGSDNRIRLTVSPIIGSGETVTVGYGDPTPGTDDARAVQNTNGTDAASFTDVPVTNALTGSEDLGGPLLVSAEVVSADASRIRLTFDEPTSALVPGTTDLQVAVDDTAPGIDEVVRDSGNRRVLSVVLDTPVRSGQTVTISYTDPTSGDDTDAIQDSHGNDAASFTDIPVTNGLPPEVGPPVLRTAETTSTGNEILLHFDRPLDGNPGRLPPPSAFTVTVEFEPTDVSYSFARSFSSGGTAVVGSGSTLVLSDLKGTIRGNIAAVTRTVTVSYTDPMSGDDTNAIQDSNGNDAASFTDIRATNNVSGTYSPEFIAASVRADGLGVDVDFDESLDTGTSGPLSAWRITVDGAQATISGLSFPDADTVRIALDAPAIERGQTVTVSYSAPTTDDSIGGITGKVSSFDNLPAFNASAQGAPPEPLTAAFGDLPARHTGEAFTIGLAFSEEFPVSEEALRAGLAVTGGALTAVAQAVEGESRNWDLTVTPSAAADAVTVTLAPKETCAAANAICTADGRGISAPVEAEVPGREPTRVVSASVTSDPGANGTWDTGETVTAAVVFNRAVAVQGPPNVKPTLGILLGSTRREAGLATTGSADTFVFSHTVTAADDGADTATVVADGITLGGTVIADNEGNEAILTFATGPALSVADATAAEGEDSTADFVVTLDPAAAGTVTVDYATADGTATAPADYGATSGTLTFAPGETSKTVSVSIVDDTVEDDGETFTLTLDNASGATLADATATGTVRSAEETDALTAEFRNLPEGGHGGAAFSFKLKFSEELPLSYLTLRDHALGVTGGTLTEVSRAETGENQAWNVKVTPAAGAGDVTVTLAATSDCAAAGALCTTDGRALSAPVSATVPATAGPETPEAPAPFRVRLEAPGEHDGASEVAFKVLFDKDPVGYSYVTLRDETVRIVRGGIRLAPTGVKRLNAPHSDRWSVKVAPGGKGDLTVSVGPFESCSDTGAVCAAGGEVLANAVAKTILGPPGLSVADARVDEAPGATVTVDYATADGTGANAATAGADYTATSDTLTFAPGETAKTVSVAVLDDSHDEGEETFTLTLSNPTGGNAWLADATATGTIVNSDVMPRAWLARFGRTAATHVLDAVEERLDGSSGESWVRLGGHRVGGGAPDVMESAHRLAPQRSLWDEATSLDPAGQDMTLDQLILGSAFHLVSNAEDNAFGPRLTAWGRVASSGFDGNEDRMTLNGTVTTAALGVDGVFTRWLTGVALAWSEGDGSFTQADAPSGDLTSTLTSVHPYVGYALGERVKLWGMLGYGSGSLELVLAGQDPLRTDIDMTMGALGVRGTVLSTAAGFELALRSDVLWVTTGSAAAPGMVQTEADTNRLRLVLEGSRPFSVGGGGLFTPTLELGLRRDGGDAEKGSGVEVGGRLVYASASGLSIEATLRALVAHEASAYREWGASGALRYDPGQAGVGLTAQVTPTWGMAASGVGRLWSQPDARGLAGGPGLSPSPAARVDAELGYGLRTLNGQGVLTPYARGSLVEGSEHAWRVGTRLALSESLNVSLEATHRQREGDTATHELALLATLPW